MPICLENSPLCYARCVAKRKSPLIGDTCYFPDNIEIVRLIGARWLKTSPITLSIICSASLLFVKVVVNVYSQLCPDAPIEIPRTWKIKINIANADILGLHWNKGTLTPSKHKLDPLAVCERPSTVKELRSFLRLTGYCQEFIKKCHHRLSHCII